MVPPMHPLGRLMEAVIQMAEQYVEEGRWFDALRLLGVGLELAEDENGVGEEFSRPC